MSSSSSAKVNGFVRYPFAPASSAKARVSGEVVSPIRTIGSSFRRSSFRKVSQNSYPDFARQVEIDAREIRGCGSGPRGWPTRSRWSRPLRIRVEQVILEALPQGRLVLDDEDPLLRRGGGFERARSSSGSHRAKSVPARRRSHRPKTDDMAKMASNFNDGSGYDAPRPVSTTGTVFKMSSKSCRRPPVVDGTACPSTSTARS